MAQKKGYSIEAVAEHLKKNKLLQPIELSADIIDKSLELIEQSSHTTSGFPSFYDASYHALAILNDCDFITADKKHYEKTKALGHIKLMADLH